MKKFLGLILSVFVFIFFQGNVFAARTLPAHWEKTSISVYVPDGNYSSSMKSALSKWASVSNGNLSFNYQKEKRGADITVEFVSSASSQSSPIANCTVSSSGNKITKAKISIAVKSPKIKKYSKDYIYTVMLHEAGIALGLKTNTRKTASIMHVPVSENQDIIKKDIRMLYVYSGWKIVR